jgi:carboxypeptidase C (cathepsin A)
VHADKATLYKNTDSWNSIANLLMFDQPAGTGFSAVRDNSSIPTSLAASTTQLHFAINSFLDVFPEFKGRGTPCRQHRAAPCAASPRHSDLWITGESYAGKYIPYLAADMMYHGTALSLRGVAIGDGWSSPLAQTSVYAASLVIITGI